MTQLTHWDGCWNSGPAHYECARTRIARLTGDLRGANRECEVLRQRELGYMAQVEKAEVEVERLRADAERLDWLDARGYTYGQSGNETPDGMEWRIDGHTYSLRDAIDAARGES